MGGSGCEVLLSSHPRDPNQGPRSGVRSSTLPGQYPYQFPRTGVFPGSQPVGPYILSIENLETPLYPDPGWDRSVSQTRKHLLTGTLRGAALDWTLWVLGSSCGFQLDINLSLLGNGQKVLKRTGLS